MLPSVVSALAATSYLVQERFPSAYLVGALRWLSGDQDLLGIIGDRVPAWDLGEPAPSGAAYLSFCFRYMLCMGARFLTAYAAAVVAASARVKRNSVPSRHMRCKTTPIRRASATVARLLPRRLATFHAQALSQFGRVLFNITVAA